MTELEKAKEQYKDNLRELDSSTLYDDIDVDSARMVAFKAGAEWQAKQSPWISVEERLPEKDDTRVFVKSSYLGYRILLYNKGKFYESLLHSAYDGSVTHWMQIPE